MKVAAILALLSVINAAYGQNNQFEYFEKNFSFLPENFKQDLSTYYQQNGFDVSDEIFKANIKNIRSSESSYQNNKRLPKSFFINKSPKTKSSNQDDIKLDSIANYETTQKLEYDSTLTMREIFKYFPDGSRKEEMLQVKVNNSDEWRDR